jgi:DNA polymerase/3'-5' exonuclease PolX
MEHQKAEAIALSTFELLQPHCDRIEVAGSIRRLKPEVKDIEIVALSKPKIRTDVFGEKFQDGRATCFINQVEELGTILKGSPVDGRYVQIRLHEGINLDLFLPQPDDYFRQFAIRTGSSDYSRKVIATAWFKMGWCGTSDGLRKKCDCIQNAAGWKWVNKAGVIPPVWQSEQEFFEWLGLKWIEPNLRNI